MSMPKVSREHMTARRNEILDAAQRVFARNGYRGSSVAQIIKESGLSAGAIYSYFPSKEDLFRAVVDKNFSLRTSQMAREPGAPPRSAGQLVIDLIGVLEEPIFTIAPQVWAEAATEAHAQEVVAGLMKGVVGAFVPELEQWAEAHPDRIAGNPREWAAAVAPVMVAVVPGFIIQRMANPDIDVQAFLDGVQGLFLS